MHEKNCLMLPQMSNDHCCGKNEQRLNINEDFDNQMSPSKDKCCYSNICLHFLKRNCLVTVKAGGLCSL